jgi:excisionase family DNA binding protein
MSKRVEHIRSICSTGLSDHEFGPLVVKPREACQLLRCGITRLYELLAAGELESFVDGRSRKITTKSVRSYIAKRLQSVDNNPHSQIERATAASLAARKYRKRRRRRLPAIAVRS